MIRLRIPKVYTRFQITFTTVDRPTFHSIALPVDGAPYVRHTLTDDPPLALLNISIAFPSTGLHEVGLALHSGSEWVSALTLYFDALLPKADSIPDA